MKPEPSGCVIDANIGVKLFLREVDSEAAHAFIRDRIGQPGCFLYVPDLFFIECASVLLKKTVREGYPAAKARQVIVDITQVGFTCVASDKLLLESFELAHHFGITLYDACYASLAKRLAVPLITADSDVIGKLSGSGISVRGL